jgi:serine phosphatase RsbU (regulator of sigma subunit)
MMASLRNAVTAYAADGSPPDEVLAKLGRLVDVGRDGRFATVLCGRIDVGSGEVALASAGHLDPVLVEGDRCRALELGHGPVLGLGGRFPIEHLRLSAGSTLLCYTGGLVERRGEVLDDGVARLCAVASRDLPLERLLDRVVTELVGPAAGDDVAVLGIRWRP